MFAAVRSWLNRRTLHHRALFSYWNGAQWRHADPAVLWHEIHKIPEGDLASLVRQADAGREPYATTLYEHLCRVFDLEEFDAATGRGLTRWEAMELVERFWRCLETLKKKFNRGWVPWQLLALEFATGPEDQGAAPKSSPDSNSASSKSGSSESTTSPSESKPA